MSDIRRHKRVLRTLTSPVEKPLLIWMAQRMPAWVTPDGLTWLGFAGAVMVFAGYALSNRSPGFLWLSVAGIVVNWFGDSLDGTLARVRHIERPRFGFYVDHTVDVVNEGLVFLGMGVSPYVDFSFAALAFVSYLALSVLSYVRTCVDGTFRVSYSRIGPTELRLVLIAATVAMFFAGSPTPVLAWGGRHETVWDLAVGAVAVTLGVVFVVSLWKGVRDLSGVDAQEGSPSP